MKFGKRPHYSRVDEENPFEDDRILSSKLNPTWNTLQVLREVDRIMSHVESWRTVDDIFSSNDFCYRYDMTGRKKSKFRRPFQFN